MYVGLLIKEKLAFEEKECIEEVGLYNSCLYTTA